ncbi:NAD-dependent dihydropyrimidine dehydrogenase subunit PreA [Alsobacter soli]|uniref:dihydrouracil dehydrogenase (NAD(+)) n=1 Tax=Alsobacter soli TaxID=2109933 RepID=A0A2T1HT68_9HYPH|nr:NAD-dependent dihydropyrimidine dehydrogenase subunit PreA [Alsobacter soli]PSC04842.1 NAD-dependent dihydropyrimidine dehydrogenase subunit PreA [Alsobacter soli]
MADLSTTFLGIKSPNPFWLASAPPTDREVNVTRAFRAGWGGVVWKTLGAEGPPIVNVNGPRYGAIHGADRRLLGFNNIELITDRPLQLNLQEIKAVKKAWPDRAVVVSLMVPCDEESWKAILKVVEETECDGVELNFGCPHGMSERGMGSAVGQVPEYIEMVARWCKQHTRMPVIVKLTPNITDIRYPARAAKQGGADAVSLINTVSSIVSIDLDRMAPNPTIDGKGSHGGYCGPAVKPIALNMVAEIARDPETRGLPISGIGGVTTWRDAAEFIALGCGTVQVCTAAMTYGFKVVEELKAGLSNWMDGKGYRSIEDFRGLAAPNVTDWRYLNLNYVTKAVIDQDLCIQCGRCHIACEDTSHQAIAATVDGRRMFVVKDEECVGCNLCIEVCPVEGCITMQPLAAGAIDPRTGLRVEPGYANWTTHPNNPMAQVAAE